MAFRPDAPAFSTPTLLTEPPIVTLSSDDAPEVDNNNGELQVGQTLRHDDTGEMFFWNGEAWAAVSVSQADGLKLSLLYRMCSLLETMVGDVD